MLPSPRIFRRRRWALMWAAGVLWFAYDVAGSAPRSAPAGNTAQATTDATGEDVTANDLAILANAMGN